METIKNYLESMFQNLPNLPQVQKAKYELEQMMEDKYQELKAEGKQENEAVAIVISEFGNLDELSKELGIETVIKEKMPEGRKVFLEEAKQYITDRIRAGYKVALGVFLCIMSPVGCIIFDAYHKEALESIGTVALMLMVTVAVALFVFSSISMGKWTFLKKEFCTIDFATAEYIQNEKDNFRMLYALMITIGVALCVFSTVPVIIFDELIGVEQFEGYGVAIMFLCISIAVVLFITASYRKGVYGELLKLNERGTMGGNFVSAQKTEVYYENKTVRGAMAVFWPTITCIYLCVSFLTFQWHVTWVIWPVAAIINKLMETIFGNNNQ